MGGYWDSRPSRKSERLVKVQKHQSPNHDPYDCVDHVYFSETWCIEALWKGIGGKRRKQELT